LIDGRLHLPMPRLFTVRWPGFARIETALLYPVMLQLVSMMPFVRTHLPAAGGTSWAVLAVATLAPFLALLAVIDRLLTVRHGYAVLSMVAVLFWTIAAASMSDRIFEYLPAGLAHGMTTLSATEAAALAAGGAALLLHLRPLIIGVRDRGFVGTRLLAGRDGSALNPRSRVMRARQGRAAFRLHPYAAWWLMFALTTAASIYRNEIIGAGRAVVDRLEFGPARRAGPNEAIATRGDDGRFVFDTVADGVAARMVYDPDASFVVLSANDAARLGLAAHRLDFSTETRVASGFLTVAAIMIDRLTIGNITQTHVPAFVARPGELNDDILGQSFLRRLASYGVEQDRLILKGG
jgi:aspartyl protease family protein